LASGFGIAFVVLAALLLAAPLFGPLLWPIYAIVTGLGKGRRV
jgi:hypothetical protein